jgi:hypothetical protein
MGGVKSYLWPNPTNLTRHELPPGLPHIFGKLGKGLPDYTLGQGFKCEANHFVS